MIIIILSLLFGLVNIPVIQTAIVKHYTKQLSRELQATISVSKINFRFFNRITIEDILVEDMKKDTLFYIEQVSAGIRRFDTAKKIYHLGQVSIDKPVIRLATDSLGQMNLAWYIQNHVSNNNLDASNTKKKSELTINNIKISNGEFHSSNEHKGTRNGVVDFNNLIINNIDGNLKDFMISDTATTVKVNQFSFAEDNGFLVHNISSSIAFTENDIELLTTKIQTNNSILDFPEIILSGTPTNKFKNFIDSVNIDISLEKSRISLPDISYFVKIENTIDNYFDLSGKFYGTISELRGRGIESSYQDFSSLKFDFDISGLPDISNSYIFLKVAQLSTNTVDITNLLSGSKNNIVIPDLLYKLGTVSFEGEFAGFITNFVANGTFKSPQGTIYTDVSLEPDQANSFHAAGLVEGKDIDLGYLTGNPDLLGNISMTVNIDGMASRIDNYSGKLTGTIDSIFFNDYMYKAISLNGSFDEQAWDGQITIDEENIAFNLLGMLKFDKHSSEFDFSLDLDKANMYALNIDKNDTTSFLSMLLTANFEGNNIDNLDGEIKLIDSNFRKNNDTLDIKTFSIVTNTKDSLPAISLRTDYIDGDLLGHYNTSEIGSIFSNLLSSLLPAKFNNEQVKVRQNSNNFTFNLNFKNTDDINQFFNTGILLSEGSSINGIFIQDSTFLIDGKAEMLDLKKFIFNDFSFLADIKKREVALDVNGETIDFPWKSSIKNFNIDLSTHPDTLLLDLKWDNQESIKNYGNIAAMGILQKVDGTNDTRFIIQIDSTNAYSNDRLWVINNSEIIIDSTSINVDQFDIVSGTKYYFLDGAISEVPSDTLYFGFNELDLTPLNKIIEPKKKSKNPTPLNLRGMLEGNLLLTGYYGTPLIQSDINIDGFSVYDSDYGKLSLNTKLNNESELLDITGGNNLNGVKMLDINGHYNPDLASMDIDFTTIHLPVTLLNSLLKSFASNVSGSASGKVNLSGRFRELVLDGALYAENVSLMIDYLKTMYTVNDSIYFTPSGFSLKNTKIADERGNMASISGTIHHTHFKNYSADLLINANQTMVLNTKTKDNEYFYGNGYASGLTTIKADNTGMSLDISASTNKNTRIYVPLNNSNQTVSDYSFITFVNKDTSIIEEVPAIAPIIQAKAGTSLNFDLSITPDAEIQLIFDSKAGDVIKAHGAGNLNLSLDSKGAFKINGVYEIDDGDYLFTLGNLLNKSFSVEEGGKITFSGDLNDTEIDIKAIYKVRASLYEILQDEKFNEKIPVECQLNLSGNLFNPLIEFGIYLPNADEETRSYLNSVISTDEELSRQFVYLLVMNSFYASTTAASPSTGTSALSVTTTEMLFNQVGNWLSQISNDFDIGFLYSPGYKSINSQEFQVALSTQILDDRVIINSDLGYRGAEATSSGNEQITGDFDIEYKLTEKIRFKVFNRYNNPYTGRQADYTQGVGVFYRQEFNRFFDLFRRKKKRGEE